MTEIAIAPWKWQGEVEAYSRNSFPLILGSASSLCLPYGCHEVQARRAAYDPLKVEIRLFRCKKSPEAFGVYSALRAASSVGRQVPLGASAAISDQQVLAWKGRFCLQVRKVGKIRAMEEELLAISETILEQIRFPSSMPVLAAALPAGGLIHGSELLFRTKSVLELAWQFHNPDFLKIGEWGEETGFVEGVYAQYIFAAHDANLFVLRYKSAEAASQVEEDFMGFHRKGSSSYKSIGNFQQAKKKGSGWAVTYRSGPLLVLLPPTRAIGKSKDTVRRFVMNLQRSSR